MFELLLLSVVLTSGYLGVMILRRFGPQQRVYGMMVVADFVLALLAFLSRSSDGPNPIADTVGVISIGAAFCLLMLPPMLRDAGRRFMSKDKLRLARLMAGLREHLQPGMGAGPEIELIDTILAVREGREDEIVSAIEDRKSLYEDPAARRALDERIVMTYLYAQRWSKAVARYERMVQTGNRPGSPQLTVEMVRAYCEVGEVDKAAELVRLIVESPLAQEPALEPLFGRGKLIFLAFLGRTGAAESIMAKGGGLENMPDTARSYWSGVARLHAGDNTGAKNAFEAAIRYSEEDKRAQSTAQKQLDRMQSNDGIEGTVASPETEELADRITSVKTGQASASPRASDDKRPKKKKLPSLNSIPLREMPVTAALALCNIAAALGVYFYFGESTDLGALVAAGANLKSATLGGEWWRIGSSMFLHVGIAHLVLNVYGLWVLGRLIEQMHGSTRTFAIYIVSGVVAGVASTALGGPTTAAGASGAVLGLMGAAAVELAVFRAHYPASGSKPLLKLLLILSVAQIAIGFFYPIVDQWGHIGGMAGGVVAGLILSPHAGIGEIPRRILSGILALASLAFVGYVVFGVATTNYTQTLRAYPRMAATSDGLAIAVPSSWKKVGNHEFIDQGISALFNLQRVSAQEGLDVTIAAQLQAEQYGGAIQAGFDVAKPSGKTVMALPAPWRGGELDVKLDDGSGLQHYRLVVFGRQVGDEIWLGTYYHPAVLTKRIEPVFSHILSSVHRRE